MKKISIIIALLSIFCTGCKTDCPSFPSELNYFPYYKGQEVKFAKFQIDTIVYIITGATYYNDDCTERGGINNKGNYCTSEAELILNSIQSDADMKCRIFVEGSVNNIWEIHVSVDLYFCCQI